MSSSDYQTRKGLVHDLAVQIDDLLKDKVELNVQLKLKDEEIARLNIDITILEDGRIELTTRLQDAHEEIGRMGMVLRHQVGNLEDAQRLNRKTKPGGG